MPTKPAHTNPGGTRIYGRGAFYRIPGKVFRPAPSDAGPEPEPRARLVVIELAAAATALAVLFWTTSEIHTNPLERIGQVSMLAGVHFRVALIAMAVVGIVAGALRHARLRALSDAIMWPAAVALVTGYFGATIAVSQRGTDWPVGGDGGDVGAIRAWVLAMLEGHGDVPAGYPPLFPKSIEWLSRLGDVDPAVAIHHAQYVLVACMGPLAYFAWRLLMGPMQAAIFAVVTTANFVEPYKPYAALSLVLMVPLLAAYLRSTRSVPDRTARRNALSGATFALPLGVMTLVYSGWLYWVAPGILVLLALASPWRRSPRGVLAHHGAALLTYVLVIGHYLWSFTYLEAPLEDRFFYFDTYVEPAYFAMWRGGMGDYDGPWPMFGEFAGIGLFPLLMIVAVGGAIALASHRSMVLVAAAMFVSSWIMRHRVAQDMWEEQAVQLYPRTSSTLYLAATVLALVLAFELVKRILTVSGDVSPVATRIGMFVMVVMLGTSAASASVDRHLPRDDETIASLAWRSYVLRNPDGTCPQFGADPACRDDTTNPG